MFMLSMGTNGKARRKATKIPIEGTVEITIAVDDHDESHMGIAKIAIIDDTGGGAAAQPQLLILLGHRMMKVEQEQQLLPPQ